MILNSKKIEILIAQKCLTFEDITKKSNLNSYTINKMLKNPDSKIRLKTIGKLAKALDVRIEDLII